VTSAVFDQQGRPYDCFDPPTLRMVVIALRAEEPPPFDPTRDAYVQYEPDAAVFVPRVGAKLLPACTSMGEAQLELMAARAKEQRA